MVLLALRRIRTARNGALALAATIATIALTGSLWLLYVAGTAAIVVVGAAAGIRQAAAPGVPQRQ